MRWEDGRQSENAEDKRKQEQSAAEISARTGMAALGLMLMQRGGGKWILVLALALIIAGYIGFDSIHRFENRFLQHSGIKAAQNVESAGEERRRMEFVSAVLAETEDVWTGIFKAEGGNYKEPGLVLYRTAIRSACGAATSSIGPFYCPNDQKIYLDEGFFDQLSGEFGAPGEFAAAYVIAHEVGHHVQNLDGTLARIDAQRGSVDAAAANGLTVRLELQADCYAGIWADMMKKQGITEGNDVELALNAAHKIGDDNLQKAAQGYAVPDSFTHGTAKQRAYWFGQGLKTGNPKSCNAIEGKI